MKEKNIYFNINNDEMNLEFLGTPFLVLLSYSPDEISYYLEPFSESDSIKIMNVDFLAEAMEATYNVIDIELNKEQIIDKLTALGFIYSPNLK